MLRTLKFLREEFHIFMLEERTMRMFALRVVVVFIELSNFVYVLMLFTTGKLASSLWRWAEEEEIEDSVIDVFIH